MKKFLWFLPLTLGLYACPFESSIPISLKPVEPVDSNLIGYWYGIIKDFSDMYGIEALDIKKESDSVYSITRYGKAIKGDIILPDTAYFTGYTTYIGDQRYMNVEGFIVNVQPRRNKPPEVTRQKVYYLAAMDMKHDTLTVKTVTETFSTRKKFGSSDDLRNLIYDLSNQHKNIFDDQYSLSYHKINRPQPLKGL